MCFDDFYFTEIRSLEKNYAEINSKIWWRKQESEYIKVFLTSVYCVVMEQCIAVTSFTTMHKGTMLLACTAAMTATYV